jgi:hypothetical protein
MTWLFSIFLNMNLDISSSIFKDHLDAKQSTWNLKISFREDFFHLKYAMAMMPDLSKMG